MNASAKEGIPRTMSSLPSLHQSFFKQFSGSTIAVGPGEQKPGKSFSAFIGRDIDNRLEYMSLVPDEVRTDGQFPFRVVSFFTRHNAYADHAKRLEASLQRFDIDYHLKPIDQIGSWEETCAFKAKFVRDEWSKSSVPVVWLDADATLESNPNLFRCIDADFAVHKWQGFDFGSGTLFFGKTDLAKALLDQWVVRCEADPHTWDQVHLQSAWCDISAASPLRTLFLPQSYLHIFDRPGSEPAVVKHWQASRQAKRAGEKTVMPAKLAPDGIRARASNQLWRSAEAGFWIRQGIDHIIPKNQSSQPEGFDVQEALHRAISTHFPVLEVGCGIGRIAALFKPQDYIGVDINPNALLVARASCPQHQLRITDAGYELPDAPTVLVYTVALHVSDDEIYGFLKKISAKRRQVVIVELMDRRWRRPGNPPVFNRDSEDLILIMNDLGFKLTRFEKREYATYRKKTPGSADNQITFLTFSILSE